MFVAPEEGFFEKENNCAASVVEVIYTLFLEFVIFIGFIICYFYQVR